MKTVKTTKVILAAVIAAAILTGCSNSASNPVPSTTGPIGATADAGNKDTDANSEAGDTGASSDNAASSNVNTEQILSAMLKVSEIPSVVVKDKSELANYYDFPEKDIVSASFAVCGSGAYPDEAAVFEVVTNEKGEPSAEVLNDVTQSVLRRIQKRSEEFSTYTPDEMYKLDDSNLGQLGKKYIVYTALADNDGAFAAAKSLIESFDTASE